mgnify:FL=1
MALLERLELVIEADAKTAEREFERIGKSATKSLEGIEDAARKVGTDAAGELAGAASEFRAAGEKLSDAAGERLDLSAAAREAAADVPRAIDDQRGEAAAAGKRVGDSAASGVKDGLSNVPNIGADIGGDAGGGLVGGFTDALDGLSGGLDDAFSALPAGIGGGVLAAGAAVGAMLVQGVGDALERGTIDARFEAALGVNGDVAARLGDTAGRIYADNFGESIQQVAESQRLVMQNFEGVGDLTEAEFEQINKAALTTAGVFDQDLRQVINATAQLMRTGLASNSTEAFDIITKGLQGPANKADDLLDTFNEYSTMFRDLGLSGEDALGLINQMVEAGARDSDKAADALKEFSIRAQDGSDTTVQGFEAIGLSAQDMGSRVAAGGAQSREALDITLDAIRSIEDPLKRNQAGVALFGTQWEDLGDSILAADLDTAASDLGKVDGAAADAAGSFDDLGSKIEELKREVSGEFADLAEGFLAPLAEAASEDRTWEGMGRAIQRNVSEALNLVPFGDTLKRWGDMVTGSDMWRNLFGGDAPEAPAAFKDVLADVRAARAENADKPIFDLGIANIEVDAQAASVSIDKVNDLLKLSGDLAGLAGDRATNYLKRIGDSSFIDNLITSQLHLRDSSKELLDGLGALNGVDIASFAAGAKDISDEAADALGDVSAAAGDAQQQIADALEFYGADAAVRKADTLRTGFVDMFEAAGIGDRQIGDLLDSMGLLPDQVNTAIELSGEDEAMAKLSLLRDFYTNADGTSGIPKQVETQMSIAIAEGRFTDAANLISIWVKDQEDGSIDDPLLIAMGLGDTAPASGEVDGWKKGEEGKPPAEIPVGANTGPARHDVGILYQDIGRLHPEVTVGLRLSDEGYQRLLNAGGTRAFGAAGPSGNGRAMGGPVSAGVNYQVNEQAVGQSKREMFVPSTPGFVLNASDTDRLISGVEKLVAGTGTGVVVNQQITTADPVQAGSESARKMRDATFLAGV